MDGQQMREIAEVAFRRQFGDVNIVKINIRQGLDFEDDSPVVDVNIVYDDNDGQVTAASGASGRKSSTKHGGRGRTTPATPMSTSSPSPASGSAIRPWRSGWPSAPHSHPAPATGWSGCRRRWRMSIWRRFAPPIVQASRRQAPGVSSQGRREDCQRGLRVAVLHVFAKKSRKTPRRALATEAGDVMTKPKPLKMEDPEFREECERVNEECALIEALVRARAAAKLTQVKVARRVGTIRSVIARLEGGRVSSSFAPPCAAAPKRLVRG